MQETSAEHVFGGDWTKTKLDLLRRYLDAFTTALKGQRFNLVYLDSHSGEGMWTPETGPQLEGSPLIALSIDGASFSELYLNDADPGVANQLQHLIAARFPRRTGIHVTCENADVFVQRVAKLMHHPKRGVIFVDPFNTKGISWPSIQAIANTQVLDAIVLFPAGAVWRQMPNLREDVAPHIFARNLNRFFGDETWKKAYDPRYVAKLASKHGIDRAVQPTMKELRKESRVSHKFIPYIYKEKLETVFGAVDMKPVRLDVTGQPYFELIFAVSNPDQRAQQLAMRIFRGVVESLT